jgi:hypothetical protein
VKVNSLMFMVLSALSKKEVQMASEIVENIEQLLSTNSLVQPIKVSFSLIHSYIFTLAQGRHNFESKVCFQSCCTSG